MRFLIVGLGRMGYSLALNSLDHGHEVVAYNRTYEKAKMLSEHGAIAVKSIEEGVKSLLGEERKVVWLMLPAGDATEKYVKLCSSLLGKGDIVIDGSNSFFRDSMRRAKDLSEKGIFYIDAGVSGGIDGARNGACIMAGGEREAYSYVEKFFSDICVKDGFSYFGKSGSGHFIKMVHNAIEYGMMESIAEGFDLIEKSEFEPDYKEVSKVWANGSVIRGWLMDLLHKAFSEHDFDSFPKEIGQSGEGMWTINEALRLCVSAPVFVDSVFRRFDSKSDKSFGNKVIQSLRFMFGGHDEKNHL